MIICDFKSCLKNANADVRARNKLCLVYMWDLFWVWWCVVCEVKIV